MQVKKTLVAGLVAFLGFSLEAYGTAKNYDVQGQKLAAASSGVIYRAFEAVNNMRVPDTICSEEPGLKKCALVINKKIDGVHLIYAIATVSYTGFSKVLDVLVYNLHQQKYQFFSYSTLDGQFDKNAYPSIINLDIDEEILDELMQKKDKESAQRYLQNPSRDYTPTEKVNAHRDIVRTLEEILNGAHWIFR